MEITSTQCLSIAEAGRKIFELFVMSFIVVSPYVTGLNFPTEISWSFAAKGTLVFTKLEWPSPLWKLDIPSLVGTTRVLVVARYRRIK